MSTIDEVKLELRELAKLSYECEASLPKDLDYVDRHHVEVCQYRANGMSISEVADLVRTLAGS